MATTLAVLVLGFFVGPPAPHPGARAAEVAGLIAALGADDFETREAAGEKLRAIGAAAVRPLAVAAAGADPEVARRADRLLRSNFDAVDLGSHGAAAPRLIDLAGPSSWSYQERAVRLPDGSEVKVGDAVYLPEPGPARDAALRYGTRSLTGRGETVARAGTNGTGDPALTPTQQHATVLLYRDLQLAGVRPGAMRLLAAAHRAAAVWDDR